MLPAAPRRSSVPRLLFLLLLAPLLAPLLPACRSEAPAKLSASLDSGVVVAPEPQAAAVGAAVLAGGGNAADAVVATHMALAVTFPYAGNLGGGGFCLVRQASGRIDALDFRETAPRAATRDMFLTGDGTPEPGASLHTLSAAGVPGSVAGMAELHARYGSRPWKELLGPAIDLAEQGFPLDSWTAGSFTDRAAELERDVPPLLKPGIDFASRFHGRVGEIFRQPELAATLHRLAEGGADEFYRGETARRLVEMMDRKGGRIAAEDLASYRAVWRTPVEGRYRGHRVVSMPLPSSGGLMLVQLLRMLETFSVPPPNSAAQIHLFAELEKRAFADRARWMGDPDSAPGPLAWLTSPAYARARAAGIRLDRRTAPDEIAAGRPEPEQTLHFSIVDRDGMAAACTTTINDAYGSGIVADGLGFLLNNEMDDFSAGPGLFNLYGVVGGEANAIVPGRRMLSTMAPTFVERPDGTLWLVLGSPGGATIVTTLFQLVSRSIDAGMTLGDAMAAPRVHHQWPPRRPGVDALRIEEDPRFALPVGVAADLTALGYALDPKVPIGNVQAIVIEGRRPIGVPDPRGIGRAVADDGLR